MFGTEEPLEYHSEDGSTLYTSDEREAIKEGISKCIDENENIVKLNEALYTFIEDEPMEEPTKEEKAHTEGFTFSWISKLLNSFESAIEFISELSDKIAANFIGLTGDIVYAITWGVLFVIILTFFAILALACTLGSIVLSVLK